MGTRGLRVVRFRKRYYIFYNQWDSYPSGLGTELVAEIPKDAVKYQEWLETQRKTAEEWEVVYEAFLTIEPGNKVTKELPEFMSQQCPSLLAPLNNTSIQWVYTIDLDRETFSVNNGAHFKLDQVPHIDWINSLANGELGDKISLPGAVSPDAVTDLVHTSSNDQLSMTLGDLTLSDTAVHVQQVVIPKDVKDIPWRQRHGPILRAIMFYFWSVANEDPLAATLLQLTPEDLPFREMAYAALCLAAGGKNIKVVSSRHLSSNGVFGFIDKAAKHNADSELVSTLASGAHLQGLPAGSSPEGTIYWLEDVLVVLTAQLYRPAAFNEGIAGIARYCQETRPSQYVDAVLISVEHVVLVHVAPGSVIQHTAIMPLFNIENHLTMNVSDRYAKSYLEKLVTKDEDFMKKEAKKMRKANQESMLKNEGINIQFGDDSDGEEDPDEEEESALYASQVEGHVNSTFYALVHLFEAAACKHMPVVKTIGGRLPNEIYTHIIKRVTDMQTRESLMEVSRTFRRICQEDLLFAEGLIFESSEACQNCNEANFTAEWFEMYDVDAGTQSQVGLERAGGLLDDGGAFWRVAIGQERNKRSLLPEVALRFVEI